ncbi:uncharacterized protein ACOB8E_014989 isoform 1-T1 [Sarcophilus harrisii]
MASPSGTPEDSGKQRGRDGKMRREEDDTPPEGKRLKLGKEGDGGKEEGEDMPCLGREDTGTQTGGEGRSAQLALSYSLAETQDYKSDNSALTSSAKSSPQGPFIRCPAIPPPPPFLILTITVIIRDNKCSIRINEVQNTEMVLFTSPLIHYAYYTFLKLVFFIPLHAFYILVTTRQYTVLLPLFLSTRNSELCSSF